MKHIKLLGIGLDVKNNAISIAKPIKGLTYIEILNTTKIDKQENIYNYIGDIIKSHEDYFITLAINRPLPLFFIKELTCYDFKLYPHFGYAKERKRIIIPLRNWERKENKNIKSVIEKYSQDFSKPDKMNFNLYQSDSALFSILAIYFQIVKRSSKIPAMCIDIANEEGWISEN